MTIGPAFGNSPHFVNGATETGDIVADGGMLIVNLDGTIVNTIVNFGGEDIVGGFPLQLQNVAIGTVLTGVEHVRAGGTASGTTVNSTGDQEVDSGGLAVGTVVNFGGELVVNPGGVTQGATLTGLNGGAIAVGFVVDAGGSPGSALGTTINHNALLEVFQGGFASGTTVNSGGFELVGNLAFTSATIVNAGGVELIYDSGTTSNTTVNGGLEVVEGKATGFTSQGSADFTTVNGGDQIVFGFADGTTVNSGFEVVWSGGISESATISKGGFDFIVGQSFHQTLNGGGEFVVGHGLAEQTQINSGGIQSVASGSTASSGTINFGGIEVVESGGVDKAASVGGTQFVEAGGTTSGADVRGGGAQIVEAGGTVISTLIDGGLLEVTSGASVGTPVSFTASGGDLQLDFSQGFTGLIAGFASPVGINEVLDLRDIAFAGATKVTFAEAPSNTSGTLTVTDGTHTANLTLLGLYSTANFSLSSDGAGGTFVKDPALVGSAASPVLAAHA
jgi:autotransporter passenger strand-loop-strand repeat protein